MPIAMFWTFVVVSVLVVGSIMGYIGWHAKEVPDSAENARPYRLNPEVLRLMAYALVVLICLLAAIYELHLNYDDPGG